MPSESNSPTKPGKKSLGLTIVIIGLLVGYVFARPHIERYFETTLPHIVEHEADKQKQQNEQVAQNDQQNKNREDVQQKQTEQKKGVQKKGTLPPLNNPGNNTTSKPVDRTKPVNQNPFVKKNNTTPKNPTFPKNSNPKNTKPKTTNPVNKVPPRTTNMPVLGQLKKEGRNTYVSTAGLRYKQAGREHRTDHIMRHGKDQPNRPGPHGVFDGDRAEIFAVIDEAYLIGIKRGPPQAKIKKEKGRTVYTVHMKRKIGYIGGQTGKRKKNPPVYHVRLVLEGKNVITAFPLKP